MVQPAPTQDGPLLVSLQNTKNQYLTRTFLRATAKWVVPGGKNSHLLQHLHAENVTTAVHSAPEGGREAPPGTRQPLPELQINIYLLFSIGYLSISGPNLFPDRPISDTGLAPKLVVTAYW